MILTCAKIQRKILIVGEFEAPESFFMGLKTTWTLHILWILDLQSIISDLNAKEIEDSVVFAK